MSATSTQKIARDFSRFGWIAVIIQAILAIIPILLLCYVLFGKVAGNDVAWSLTDYLAILGLAILAFTTFWAYRYTRIAQRIADPARRPPRSSLIRTLWVGLWASSIGILVSLVLLFIEVIRLLILFLRAPQAGVPVFQTQAENRLTWVSAIDAVSLLAELCTLTGELLVLGLTLWLLFRVTTLADDYDRSLAGAAA
jgi:Protein of unknown function (DUF3611)